jgi:hypothetical protein
MAAHDCQVVPQGRLVDDGLNGAGHKGLLQPGQASEKTKPSIVALWRSRKCFGKPVPANGMQRKADFADLPSQGCLGSVI